MSNNSNNSKNSNTKKHPDKKSNGQMNGKTNKSTTKIGKVPVDFLEPDPEKVEAFRRIVSAEDFEELDDNQGNQNGLILI